jgi:protein disulfide-isomerase-like protein
MRAPLALLLVLLAAAAVVDSAAGAGKQLPQRVVTLSAATFDETVKEGRWLVKFYAPWCGHCKRLAPVLEQVAAKHFGGRIGVAKVDVDQHPTLKKRFSIDGYPTLHFFENGELGAPFTGGREVDSIAQWGARVVAEPVRRFSAAELARWLNEPSAEREPAREPVSFVLLLPGAEAGTGAGAGAAEPSLGALELGALELIARGLKTSHLFAASGGDAAWDAVCGHSAPERPEWCAARARARLARYEVGERVAVFEGNLLDPGQVTAWVVAGAAPTFAMADMHNFELLSSAPGKRLVLAAFDPADASQGRYLEHVHALARGEPPLGAARGKVLFASINGVKWAAFLSEFGISGELPRTVVVDFANQTFYEDVLLEGNRVRELVNGAFSGLVPPQSSGGVLGGARRLVRLFRQNLPFSAGLLVLVLGVAVLFFYLVCVGDYEGEADEKAGETGGGAAGSGTVPAPAKSDAPPAPGSPKPAKAKKKD